MSEGSARVVDRLDPLEALAWIQRAPGGAIAFMVMSATGSAVDVTPLPDAELRLRQAVDQALAAGALRALAWQAQGRIPEGSAMTVIGASAASRKDAQAALALLQDGLSGVAQRTDVHGF